MESDNALAFVVPLCIKAAAHARLAENCLRSIRRFYPSACVVVVEDVSSARALSTPVRTYASRWLSNPFPGSGEFGALFVAAHFNELTGVQPQRVMMLHDSTALLRALTADELARTEHAVWPLWNTPRSFVTLDCATALVNDVVAPAVDADRAAQWRAALAAPDATVTFGCMVAGPPAALRATWDAGMVHAAPHITSRPQRCRVERLVTFAMIVAGSCPRGSAGPIPALCGSILAHPHSFDERAPMTPWDAPERPPTEPFLVKHWLGR